MNERDTLDVDVFLWVAVRPVWPVRFGCGSLHKLPEPNLR